MYESYRKAICKYGNTNRKKDNKGEKNQCRSIIYILKNNKKHDGKTNSIGFCFLNVEDFTPEEAMHFLSGIVTFDVCAVFETDEKLDKTYGIYAKPIKSTGNPIEDLMNLFCGFNERFTADEYCITEYDKKRMKLIKYSEEIWKQWNPRENQEELKWVEV